MTSTTPPAPTLKWPGAKWNIASWIIEHMPRHDCYIDPYFGSGAVFFCKRPSNVELLNDRDGAVVNFFRVVRNRPNELAGLLALTPWAREEYDECRRNLDRGDEMERARAFAVAMWQSLGVRGASPGKTETGIVNNGWRNRHLRHQSPLPTWQRLPERIQWAAMRLLKAQIEGRPALDVIARHCDKEVLLYADPPYHPDTRQRRLYRHEMNGEEHAELLDLLRAHHGPVLLSGYHCPLYDEGLSAWQRFETQVRTQSQSKRTEVLWLNPVAWKRLKEERQIPLQYDLHTQDEGHL